MPSRRFMMFGIVVTTASGDVNLVLASGTYSGKKKENTVGNS
jgi:hypothetical protein